MKRLILAGLSLLALGACATAETGRPLSTAFVPTASGPYRLLAHEDVARGRPVLTPGGDAKAYVGTLIDWAFAPGFVAQRSGLLFDAPLTDLPEGQDLETLATTLAAEGHANAKLIGTGSTPGAIQQLADEGNTVARLALEVDNISSGSLAERISALDWLRARSRADNDAALALGIFLITQTQAQPFDFTGEEKPRLPTLPELKEGAALLKHVATAGVPLDIMMQIIDTLGILTGSDGPADADMRAMLEVVVANTKAEPISPPLDGGGGAQAEGNFVSLMHASVARTLLAGMLEEGTGGPADLARATTLYGEALESSLDFSAYEALKRLGVDVSKYDELINPSFEDEGGMNEPVPEPAAPPQ